MDLSFRAITAVFGHFGIEWNLAEASEDDLHRLAQWIGFYKERRRLLLGGETVRMDGADPRTRVHGVVAHDRSAAIFAAAVLDSSNPEPPARLKLRGLDPTTTYRVAPLFIGPLPSGLEPPAWWGAPSDADALAQQEYWDRHERSDVRFEGGLFRGDVLQAAGLASPRLHPDQAVVYLLESSD
jgi:alpha-galactosidase